MKRTLGALACMWLVGCGDGGASTDGASVDGASVDGGGATTSDASGQGSTDAAREPADAFVVPRGDAGSVGLPRPASRCREAPVEVTLRDVSTPTTVVGDGTASSCTEAALRAAVTRGGIVTFACGAAPFTLELTEPLVASNAAGLVLDGGGLVTLSGGDRTRILTIDACTSPVSERCDTDARPDVVVQRLAFLRGHSRDVVVDTKSVATGGGAIHRRGGTLTVIDCDFVENSCDPSGQDVSGGAITSQHTQTTTIVRSNFVRNTCANGGALGALQASYVVIDSRFEENEAQGSGGNHVPGGQPGDTGGNGGNGGALVIDGQNNTITLCGIEARRNRAHYAGSALFRTGYSGEAITIRDSLFEAHELDRLDHPETDVDRHNAALGTLYLQGVSATVERTAILGNQSNGGTPGVFLATMGPTRFDATNVTIGENVLSGEGIGGGLVASGDVTGTLRHVTIARNGANFGGAMIFATGLTFIDSIIADNTRDESNPTGLYNPRNCFFPGGGSAMGSGVNLQWPETNAGGLTAEPRCISGVRFADPLLGARSDEGYAPGDGSPARGAASACPATDQRGRARPSSGCAVGAIEPG